MTIDASLPDWFQSSPISGVIARVDKHTIGPLRELGVPIVDVRCRLSFEGVPRVETDDSKVAQLAFDHLWERGFRRFAFCGYQFAHFSVARLNSFRDLVESAGCPLSIYETPSQPGAAVSSVEQCGQIDVDPVSRWLNSLSSPTGLFVCNDIRGQQVLNACQTLGIAVPDDLGVIGVDDDDAICPLSDPPLSSVRPNAEQIGYRAAEILHHLINGGLVTIPIEYVPPITVAQRLSTQVIAIEDRELARVCRFIREHACQGINVDDVAEFTTLSRRQLERRFREHLGRTPHNEITAIQVQRVKQLLVETSMTLEQIAPLAGYKHKERLGAVFKRETGVSPSQYRDSLSGLEK